MRPTQSAPLFHLSPTLQKAGLEAEGNHGLVKALENLADFEIGA